MKSKKEILKAAKKYSVKLIAEYQDLFPDKDFKYKDFVTWFNRKDDIDV